jgi:hypothetical protein
VAYHSNQIHQYKYELNQPKTEEVKMPDQEKIFGELESHKLPLRGVQISDNDGILATHSFDSVKIWKIDFMAQQE